MEIKLTELKSIIDRLFKHIIEVRGVEKVEVKKNLYWNIPEETLYNVNEDPKDIDIGSLCDEWDFISSLLDESKQPVAYQLTEVAAILRYIGEVLGKELAKSGG